MGQLETMDNPADSQIKGSESFCRGRANSAAFSVLLLVALCGALFLTGASTLPLTTPDEARCGIIVRNMLKSGDWIVPRYEGEVYFDKPAPFFWLAAITQLLTGKEELAGRLVAALAATGAVLVAWALGKRMFGPLCGLLAGILLATMGEFLFMARWYRMDMPFVAGMWAALWWFWRQEKPPEEKASGANWPQWIGFYAFCGVATLFKGPAGLVLPALVVAVYFLLSGAPRRVLEFFNPLGILAYMLIAVPWYVLIMLRESNYVREFFFKQNIGRFAGRAMGSHKLSAFVYIPTLLAGIIPWTFYLIGALARYFPHRWKDRNRGPEALFLLCAAFVPFVFFSLSKTKLLGYILVVIPPLAVLIGALLAQWVQRPEPDRSMRVLGWAMTVFLPLVAVVAIVGLGFYLRLLDLWAILALSAVILICWRMIAELRRDRRGAFLKWTLAGAVGIYLYLILHSFPVGHEMMSARSIGRLVNPALREKAEFIYWKRRNISFEYYAGIREGERIDTGKPGALEQIASLMASDRPVYCYISDSRRLHEMQKACAVRLYVLGKTSEGGFNGGRRYLIANRSAEQLAELTDGPPATRPAMIRTDSKTLDKK